MFPVEDKKGRLATECNYTINFGLHVKKKNSRVGAGTNGARSCEEVNTPNQKRKSINP